MIRRGDAAIAAQPRPKTDTSAPSGPSRVRRLEPLIIGTASVVIVLTVWQLVASARIMLEMFLPGPSDIAIAFANLIQDPELIVAIQYSGEELAIGYGLAVVLALPIGLAAGWYRRVNHAIDPFVSVLYATPRVALIPLLIIWFGIGIWSKVAVIFLGAFFPILINTAAGVRNLDPALIKAARSFSASDRNIFRTIALPGSVPFILTGMRLGIGHALVGVVVGEFVAAQHGIGQLMQIYGATFQTSKVFALLVILTSTGVLLTYVLARLERRFQSWRPPRQ